MDIRLCSTFIDHPKTIKLERRFGLNGLKCLLRLWMFTAQRHPKGRLVGMSAEDIEIASGWNGDNGEFFSSLIELRWVDSDDDGYSVHGWEEHQSYVYFSPERSEKARVASRARYRKCSEDATSSATSIAPSIVIRDNNAPPSPSPSPSPVPTPSPEKEQQPPSASATGRMKKEYEPSGPALDLVEYWEQTCGKVTEKRRAYKNIDDVIKKKKLTGPQLGKAIQNYAETMEEKGTDKRYYYAITNFFGRAAYYESYL